MTFKDIIFNKTLFVSCLIIFTLFVTSLLVFEQCTPKVLPKAPDIVLYPLDKAPVTFPMMLNYDRSLFTPEQENIIKNSAIVWKNKSNKVVDIRVNTEWKAPVSFSRNAYEFYGEKTIWLKDISDPEITKLQLQTSVNADGITIGDFIVIIKDSTMTNSKFSIITLHEIGHMIGLEHIKEQYPALMNLGGNNGVITEYDLITLCYKYDCK